MNSLIVTGEDETRSKLNILGESAKYDVSCSSSGSTRKNKAGGVGNASVGGICHSWTADGRCVSLLKVLYTNDCIYDCAYCVNRRSEDRERRTFTPKELADITIQFYRRNYIEGFFLSSAIKKSPDYTMERMVETVRLLREEYKFNGYIHLKAIPGADPMLIKQGGMLADRMSVNIELPTKKSLKLLAPQKSQETILIPMTSLARNIKDMHSLKQYRYKTPDFVPAGQTTQMIVGASPESDFTIMKLSEGLYNNFKLKRVYYSAFVHNTEDSRLPAIAPPPLLREHRLYQADWLLRFYKFSAMELLSPQNRNFSVELDPKSDWALRNLHLFPIEVNIADYENLLRVPGIGVRSARRILTARRVARVEFEHLKMFGVVLKRAKHFITCMGKYQGLTVDNEKRIKLDLMSERLKRAMDIPKDEQLNLFRLFPEVFDPIPNTGLTGEL